MASTSPPTEQEFTYELRIPKERIAVLIGKSGEQKKLIEEQAHVSLKVDSKEGDVFISGKDPLHLYTAREIIKAIGRGFNPEIAQLLLKQDYVFELITLDNFAKNKVQMERVKGRVIGAEGKSRKTIEQLTETFICVFGKTIGIIGLAGQVPIARSAIEMLLQGSPHASVYKWLEGKRRNSALEAFENEAGFIKTEEEMKESAKKHKEKTQKRRRLKEK